MLKLKLNSKRALSWALTLVMVLSLMPAFAPPAQAASAVWNGTVAASYAGGSGTEGSPYLISTAEQLAKLAADVNGGNRWSYYKLTQDIVLNDTSNWTNWGTSAPARTWTPIGSTTSNSFRGHFDGGGYSVSGIYINSAGTDNVGLFGIADGTGFINVTVKESYIKGKDYVGGVAGNGSANDMSGLKNSGTVIGNTYVGGVIGYAFSSLLNCENSGKVTGTTMVGGVLGFMGTGTLSNCKSPAGLVTPTPSANFGTSSTYIGHICGNLTGTDGGGNTAPPLAPVITIDTLSADKTFAEGGISGGITVVATVTESAVLSYQWYSNTTASNTGGTKITGATGYSYTLPTTLTEGKYYYYCVVSATKDAAPVTTNVVTVTVTIPSVALYFKEDPNSAGTYNLFAGTGSTVYSSQTDKWSVSGTTLTLKEGFSYTTSANFAIIFSQASTLKVEGDATLEVRNTGAAASYGISGNLETIDVAEYKTLTATSENATSTGNKYGFNISGTLTKKGKGTINAISGNSSGGDSVALTATGFVMDEGVVIAEAGTAATASGNTSYGIGAYSGGLKINGGEIYASGKTGAVTAGNSVTLAEGAAVRGIDAAGELYSVPAQFTAGSPKTIQSISGGTEVQSAKIFFPNYYISYDGNKGAGSTDPVGVPAKSARNATKIASAGASPTREGYSFGGWNTESNGSGTNYAPGADYFAESDVTLYAKWTPNTYTVTLDKNGGTGGTTSVTATFDAKLPTIAVGNLPTKSGGYEFDGYYDEVTGGDMYYTSDGTGADPWTKTEGGTLYAQWYFYTAPSTNEYWHAWTELPTTPGSGLSGNYKVSRNTTIQATAAGSNGLRVTGTTQIYIPKNVTLTVYGGNGSGTTGGGAAIQLPSGQTLTVRGEGTLRTYGGASGTRANGSRGGDSSFTSTTATMAAGGKGGNGGGGAGAGIGGNGGTGGAGAAAPAAATANKDQKGSGNNGNTGTVGSAGGTMGRQMAPSHRALQLTTAAIQSQALPTRWSIPQMAARHGRYTIP